MLCGPHKLRWSHARDSVCASRRGWTLAWHPRHLHQQALPHTQPALPSWAPTSPAAPAAASARPAWPPCPFPSAGLPLADAPSPAGLPCRLLSVPCLGFQMWPRQALLIRSLLHDKDCPSPSTSGVCWDAQLPAALPGSVPTRLMGHVQVCFLQDVGLESTDQCVSWQVGSSGPCISGASLPNISATTPATFTHTPSRPCRQAPPLPPKWPSAQRGDLSRVTTRPCPCPPAWDGHTVATVPCTTGHLPGHAGEQRLAGKPGGQATQSQEEGKHRWVIQEWSARSALEVNREPVRGVALAPGSGLQPELM